eukprot:TRINITY_DN2819_c0_g1_i2.p1 TRINITY_DN2819_c0_g1~~TRINITY_DN2819_c0_g1_i2.p1  ORF type:complete len:113 (+),score=29.84 TRINITY_DN2819_c0_g1_i2:288-626(+)
MSVPSQRKSAMKKPTSQKKETKPQFALTPEQEASTNRPKPKQRRGTQYFHDDEEQHEIHIKSDDNDLSDDNQRYSSRQERIQSSRKREERRMDEGDTDGSVREDGECVCSIL